MTTIIRTTPAITVMPGSTVHLERVRRAPQTDLSVQVMTVERLHPGQQAWFWMDLDADVPTLERSDRRRHPARLHPASHHQWPHRHRSAGADP